MTRDKSSNKPPEAPARVDDKRDKKGYSSQKNNSKKRFWRDWEPTEKFTCIIAIFTVVYSIITCGLYIVTKDTLVINKRAFLYCKEVNIIPNVTNKGKIDATKSTNIAILWVNSGETPARKVMVNANYCQGKELPNGFGYPSSAGERGPIMVIAPKAEMTTIFALPNAVFNKLEENNLFIYGDISYIDAFNVSRKTHFCQKYVSTRFNMKDASPDKYLFSPCGKHECYDDDCPNSYGNNPNPIPPQK